MLLLLQGLHSQTAYSLVLVGFDDIQPPNYAEPPIVLQVHCFQRKAYMLYHGLPQTSAQASYNATWHLR